MKSVFKAEIINTIAGKTGLNQADASVLINTFLDEIKTQYKLGNKVELIGFGSFSPYLQKARTYIDFNTKQPKSVPEKRVLKFKASKSIK